mgnify:CR=1 FL=1
MTKKDLFDGLNYIDDQIIEEAQRQENRQENRPGTEMIFM